MGYGYVPIMVTLDARPTSWLPVLLNIHVGPTAIRSIVLTSLFHCQTWAAWSPLVFQKISVVSWHFVLILWGLPHLSFKYLDCSHFSPSFTDFGPYVEMYSSKPRVLALIQAQEQGIASPIRLQGSSKAPSLALRLPCTNLYSLL